MTSTRSARSARVVPRRRVLQFAVGSAALAGLSWRRVSAQSSSTPQATPASATPGGAALKTTALLVSATNDPLRVAGSDGMDHLEYDLIVTNAFPEPVTLTLIEFLGADGQVLLRLEGGAIAAVTQPVLGVGPLTQILGSMTVGVVMDLIVPRDDVHDRIDHRITYELAADAELTSLVGSFLIEGPLLAVDPRAAVVIAPPLHGSGWLTFSGVGDLPSLHRSIRVPVDGGTYAKSETFAIDWLQLVDGRVFEGDGVSVEQWYCYGSEVTSASAGTVVAIRDGMPDEAPNSLPDNLVEPADYGGNQITVQLGDGVWAFYGHFIPGSVAVAVGDPVTPGQLLGLLGNSGNTSAPHLHFGLLDGPDPLANNSLPMVFDSYTLLGVLDEASRGIFLSPDSPASDIVGTPRPEQETLALNWTVTDFT